MSSSEALSASFSIHASATLFDAEIILKATGGLSEAHKVDEGSFGVVYRGRLPTRAGTYSGREVAIKVLKL